MGLPGHAALDPAALTRRDASGQIARQLRHAIISGHWRPGDRLPSEQELAATFDVARGTAREALKSLSASGMVTSTRGGAGGTFVAVPAAEEVASQLSDSILLWFRAGDVSVGEVDEARMVLETQVVALAAQRRTQTDLDAIAAALTHAMEPGIDMQEWLGTDLEFHTAITHAAGNRILELAMTSVHLVRPLTNTVFVDLLDRTTIQAQHTAIFDAICNQDVEGARQRLLEHVRHLEGVRAQALADRASTDVAVASL